MVRWSYVCVAYVHQDITICRIHDIEGRIYLCDTLSNQGRVMNGFDVVLTNPPFGTKKGGERAAREDFTFESSNKQLNFLQHIYKSLNQSGNARAAVVIPDIPTETTILNDLMEKCNLHTVLRLPTGIFYKPAIKTNVLFFSRGKTDSGNTKNVWYYDLRTDMHFTLVENPIKREDFYKFEEAYKAKDRNQVDDVRWNCFDIEEIKTAGNIFDIGLIKSESDNELENDPIESSQQIISDLEEAVDLLKSVIAELNILGGE